MLRAIRKTSRIITADPRTVTTRFPSLHALEIVTEHPTTNGDANSVTKIVSTHVATDPPVPTVESPLLTYSDPATCRRQAVYRPSANPPRPFRRRFSRPPLTRRHESLIPQSPNHRPAPRPNGSPPPQPDSDHRRHLFPVALRTAHLPTASRWHHLFCRLSYTCSTLSSRKSPAGV